MTRAEGFALAPYDVLGGGKIRSDAEEARQRETGEMGHTVFGPKWGRTEEERNVCLVLEQIAKEAGARVLLPVRYLSKTDEGKSCRAVVLTSCDRIPLAQDSICVPSWSVDGRWSISSRMSMR